MFKLSALLKFPRYFLVLLFSFGSIIFNSTCFADAIHIAVASNFSETAKNIVSHFNKRSNTKVLVSTASTGKLYHQIKNGAPFDLLLSADSLHAEKLIKDNLAISESLKTYAIGKLVMQSHISSIGSQCKETLTSKQVKFIAIANPSYSPYGLASQEVLQSLGLIDLLNNKLVKGENVAQTMHFLNTHNAQIAFVAKSQSMHLSQEGTCIWHIPQKLYTPIEQKMVILNKASSNKAAQEFANFMNSEAALTIIRNSGYTI